MEVLHLAALADTGEQPLIVLRGSANVDADGVAIAIEHAGVGGDASIVVAECSPRSAHVEVGKK